MRSRSAGPGPGQAEAQDGPNAAGGQDVRSGRPSRLRSLRSLRAPLASLLLVALVALGCRTTGSIRQPLYPALVAAPSPAEARELAAKMADPLLAAETAWLLGNDRALARAQIERGMAAAGERAQLQLLRALIALAELDRKSALEDLLAVIERAPRSGEAEVALIVLYDWLAESRGDAERILAALERSGVLREGTAPASHVAIATAIALRLDDQDQERLRGHLSRGGWLTAFESNGPLGPVNDTFFEEAPARFRGMVPPRRVLRPTGRRLPLTAGDLSGIYRLSGCFELDEAAASGPLSLEAHLSAPARLVVDGTQVFERAMSGGPAPSLIRRTLHASPGWHCAELTIRAHRSTKPSLSLLAADGRRVVVKQAVTPAGPVGRVTVSPLSGSALRGMTSVLEASGAAGALDSENAALSLIRELTFDPSRALFGRVLGTIVALSYWMDDTELARELLEGTELAAPRSAVVHVAHARLSMWASLPDAISQAALRQALELDPSYPSVLLALAQLVWKDSPDDAEDLIERAKQAAPDAAGPHELSFRLARQRGWNAEAARNLESALARNPTKRMTLEGAQFYRGLQRIEAAAALERQAVELAHHERAETVAAQAQARGDLDAAIQALLDGVERSDDAAERLARAAEIELGRGRIAEAIGLAERALAEDPLATPALKVLLRAYLARDDAASARKILTRLQSQGESTLRMEASVAVLEKRDLEVIDTEPWLAKALAFDVMPLIEHVGGTKTPRGLDPGDRWSRHRSVLLLDRAVDVVRPDGRALSLRHSITRLQTKEAADALGEINLPGDALTVALRTLKPDGRTLEVDRHSGKEDLSFSGLAPGDAVERKWITMEDAATPWGGYLRRFYFKNTSPIVRADLTVVVPKGSAVWTRSYNGAPLPVIHELADRTIYLFRQEDVEPFEPEPHSVPYEEYIPFVVMAVDLDAELARRTNTLGMPEAARLSHSIVKKADELVAGMETPEGKIEALFSWTISEIGLGGASDVEQVLATRRGERTGLLAALLRAAGFDARIALAQPGTSAQLEHSFPNPLQYNLRFIRIEWGDGKRLWARVDTETPWLGLLPPSMRNGHYLLAEKPAKLRPIPVRDQEVERWPLESQVELAIDDNGTAKGKVMMRLPGTFGAELRDFVLRARKDEIMRHFQGWIGTVIPGARLLETEISDAPPPAPLTIQADILVGHFMVRDGTALIAEQLFDVPLAHVSLGLPTLGSYLRVPNRSSPLALTELTERMTVSLSFPEKCGTPLETPRSFHRGADWGVFQQAFSWDAEKRRATLVVEHAVPQARLSPAAFSAFRESAQEILQASRNRLIVPLEPGARSATATPLR